MNKAIFRDFTTLLAVYTVLYVLGVAGDHASTLLHTSRGGVETNAFFRNADGSLAQVRALSVFILLYPLCAATLWVGHRRTVYGDAASPLPLPGWVIGRTAASALRVPLILVFAKFIVTALNLLNLVLPVSTSKLLKAGLSPYGIWSMQTGYLITASIILGIAFVLSGPVTEWLMSRIQTQTQKKDLAHA